MKKTLNVKVVVLCFCLFFLFNGEYVKVSATQDRTVNFNKNYTVTGNGASDMVSIARAQLNRTQQQFGYTEAWCADFISDCAKLANQSSAIPTNGSCYNLMTSVKNAGGYIVEKSMARAGDLVFFSSSKYPNGGAHVELVYDYSGGILKSIGGNCLINNKWIVYDRSNGQSSSVTYYCVIRPNYQNVNNPTDSSQNTDFTVNLTDGQSLSGDSFAICGCVKNGGTYPWLDLYMDYGHVSQTCNNSVGNYAFYLDTTKYEDGKHLLGVKLRNQDGYDYTSWYTIYINNSNPASISGNVSYTVNLKEGTNISGDKYWIGGTVYGGGTYPWLDLYLDYEHISQTCNNSVGNYGFALDTTKYEDGKHLLGVKLRNQDGYDYTSWYTIYINNSNPASISGNVSYTVNLKEGATISGDKYCIGGTVYGGGTYPWLNLLFDNIQIDQTCNNSVGNYAFYLDTTKYENGKHIIGVKLCNEDGYQYTTTFNVYIYNEENDFSEDDAKNDDKVAKIDTSMPDSSIKYTDDNDEAENTIDDQKNEIIEGQQNDQNNRENFSTIDIAKENKFQTINNIKVKKIRSKKKNRTNLEVSWKKIKKVTGFQIRYTTDSNMKKKLHYKKGKKNKFKLMDLKGNQYYYMQVRTFIVKNGITYFGKWGKKKKINLY